MKDKIYLKILPFIILIQPIFDILTSFMTTLGISLTIGVVMKVLMLFLFFVYLVFFDKNHLKYNIIYICITLIFFVFNIINNYNMLSSDLFSYFSYLVKYIYFNTAILFFIRWYSNGNRIRISQFKIPIAIVCVTLIISILTNTYFSSYPVNTNRIGISGWYSSANELGGLLCIFFPIALYNAFHNDNSRRYEIIYFILCGFSMLMLGTKVGLLGYFFTLILYLVYRIITIKKYKLNKSFFIVLACLVLSISLWNYLPAVHNTKVRMDFYGTDLGEINEEDIDNILLSGRNTYQNEMNTQRKSMTILNYLFGKTYYRSNGDILIVEKDFHDIYYMYGLYGLALTLFLIIYIVIVSAREFFKNFKRNFFDIKNIIIVLAILLTFGVAYISGHTLMSPSVSIYLSIILVSILYNINRTFNDKKRILFGTVHMEYGGIETTLINLLNKINYEKYDVDLVLLKKDGELFKNIPNNVNIVSSIDSKIINKIILSNNIICKIIKHLLFNYFTALLWTTNKKYDVAISFSGYYAFIDRYISSTSAKKKLIWVHTDVKRIYDTDAKYKRIFDKRKNKYKRFDNIICVSKSVEKSFTELLPEHKNKTKVLFNIINLTQKNDDENSLEKLKEGFNLISVGRLTAQKDYCRLVEIQKKLVDQGHKTNVYLIGSGEDYDKIKNLIYKYQIQDCFILCGYRRNIYEYMRQADLYVCSSQLEGLPTVLLEALTCNLPFVGPDISGVRDIAKYIAPKKSCIITENTTEALYNGVVDAINGKVNKNFKFDLEKYNKNNMKEFYKLIGG